MTTLEEIKSALANLETQLNNGMAEQNIIAISKKSVALSMKKSEATKAALAALPAILGNLTLSGDDAQNKSDIQEAIRLALYAGFEMSNGLAQLRSNMKVEDPKD